MPEPERRCECRVVIVEAHGDLSAMAAPLNKKCQLCLEREAVGREAIYRLSQLVSVYNIHGRGENDLIARAKALGMGE